MSRWRAPAPGSSPYITPEGYRVLEGESAELWKRRVEVTRALSAAAAEGDRSENAEYIYRKKELREIDRRIRYLQKRMPKLKIVNEVGDKNKIFFGATVTIEDESGGEYVYRIVGADEIDREQHYISVDSPMARSLVGREVEEEVIVLVRQKKRCYVVTGISYEDEASIRTY